MKKPKATKATDIATDIVRTEHETAGLVFDAHGHLVSGTPDAHPAPWFEELDDEDDATK